MSWLDDEHFIYTHTHTRINKERKTSNNVFPCHHQSPSTLDPSNLPTFFSFYNYLGMIFKKNFFDHGFKRKKNTLENEKKIKYFTKVVRKKKQSSLGILKHKQFIHINLSSLLCHFFFKLSGVCLRVSQWKSGCPPPKPPFYFNFVLFL